VNNDADPTIDVIAISTVESSGILSNLLNGVRHVFDVPGSLSFRHDQFVLPMVLNTLFGR